MQRGGNQIDGVLCTLNVTKSELTYKIIEKAFHFKPNKRSSSS